MSRSASQASGLISGARSLKRLALAATIAAAATLSFAGPASAGSNSFSNPACGLDDIAKKGAAPIYLSPITKLKGISCKEAQRVASGARKSIGENRTLCSKNAHYAGWTIRNPKGFLLQSSFTKGSKSFVFASQGAC